MLGIKLLQKLCGKEEFIGVFKSEKIERVLILVLGKQYDGEVNSAAAFILNRMLHSIYSRDIVVSLISMENNLALETLSRLCLPPTNNNVITLKPLKL